MEKGNSERYVVVGFGWVGQANTLSFAMSGLNVAYFDIGEPPRHYAEYTSAYSRLPRLKKVDEWDGPNTWYIVCVGDRVSDTGVQDVSNIRSALEQLTKLQGGVILRSTIVPDTLASVAFDYYLPEFLHEKYAVRECLHPHFFVVGRREGARPAPQLFSIMRARAHKSFEGTPREAAFIKYLSNLWNALRISFVNEFGDAIGRPTDQARLSEIERVLGFLFENRSYFRYGKAFGGHCLPKDARAFLGAYGKSADLSLIRGLYDSNEKHRTLEAQFPLLSEWYSVWETPHIGGWRALGELGYAMRKQILLFARNLAGLLRIRDKAI